MELVQITPNMYLEIHPDFKSFEIPVISDLLAHVSIDFGKAIGKPPFSSKDVYVSYHEEGPMCSKYKENSHRILLSVQEDYWCQWLYQFAHEYCHHLIDGELAGNFNGLFWFEESMCELSSMYHLRLTAKRWIHHNLSECARFAPILQGYLENLLIKNQDLYEETSHPGFLQSWDRVLREPQYHRDRYNAIATCMFPLFLANPHLWKIIFHMGDSAQWNSPEDLFDHLQEKATPDYASSLRQLRHRLFL